MFAQPLVGSESKANETNDTDDEQPILLLPPSTTPQSTLDDMDIGSNTSGKDTCISDSEPAMARRKPLACGLGNLGNTCFMNSTLQCLAHTEPIRRYFLSGEYEADLNRDNPLGTGGELATQFANLIAEMWGIPAKRRNVVGSSSASYASTSTSAVYPRSFKYCLGKHAEQFMGYDQHDSQELATYLLDALHEDTNRVTKKPYIEKPEQGEDEPDEVAANKAWALHLQREDSQVLENFMGQVKSRLECCEEDCNRVSTTFDPFMYLSVPIPGASERKLKVTFCPLDPNQKMKNLSLTINKTASLRQYMEKMNDELINLGICNEPIPLHDLCPVDVWSNEIFSWYKADSEIDRIRDSDTTFIYQLRSLLEVQEISSKEEKSDNFESKFVKSRTRNRYKLDLETITKLNKDDEWMKELENYVRQPNLLYSMFNPNRGTIDERMDFHRRLENFIDLCHNEIMEEEPSGLKRTREESDDNGKVEGSVSPFEDSILALSDRCDASRTFKGVNKRHDVAILEFCANKMRQFILRLVREKKNRHKDGITIQIVMRRPYNASHSSTQANTFASPLVIRIPANMTVYGFRQEVANRISRSLRSGHPAARAGTGESSSEMGVKRSSKSEDDELFGSPALLILRQIPLTFDRKQGYSNKANLSNNKKLGMLEKVGSQTANGRQAVLAVESDEAEQALVADIVGPNGTVTLDWPMELCDRSFDLNEYEASNDGTKDESSSSNDQVQKVTSVLDCIKKYCQMEQLEETEMWYCNRCKKHVQAWKQFHLYRAPPILIVHLKRFHYSATTHRRDKITAFIDFPLEGLDLTESFSHYSEEEKPIYDCYAVSNHYGGLGGGHYTAYTLSDDGSWCHYDDSKVTTNIDKGEVVSEAAYVLYYRRQDVSVGQNFVDTSAMICEQAMIPRDSSEVSSNNTTQAADDDMAMDDADEASSTADIRMVDTDMGSQASSRTCSSPMGSVEGDNDSHEPGDLVTDDSVYQPPVGDDFPLQ